MWAHFPEQRLVIEPAIAGDSSKDVTFKMKSRLFQFAEKVKFKRISLELITWLRDCMHSSLEKKKKKFVVACLRPP